MLITVQWRFTQSLTIQCNLLFNNWCIYAATIEAPPLILQLVLPVTRIQIERLLICIVQHFIHSIKIIGQIRIGCFQVFTWIYQCLIYRVVQVYYVLDRARLLYLSWLLGFFARIEAGC